jgi:hypothetical protein
VVGATLNLKIKLPGTAATEVNVAVDLASTNKLPPLYNFVNLAKDRGDLRNVVNEEPKRNQTENDNDSDAEDAGVDKRKNEDLRGSKVENPVVKNVDHDSDVEIVEVDKQKEEVIVVIDKDEEVNDRGRNVANPEAPVTRRMLDKMLEVKIGKYFAPLMTQLESLELLASKEAESECS